MQANVLIFDFDGTLADTLSSAHAIFNQLSQEFGFRAMPEGELAQARRMSAREIIQAYGIAKRKLPQIAARGLSLLRGQMESILPFPGVVETLHTLSQRGFRLGILTSNSETNVRVFLQRHNLEIFDFIRSSSRLFGKARELRDLLKKHRWQPEEVLFIGDECRDIEAGQEVGLRVVAVTWGYNTAEALAALQPLALLDDPRHLLSQLQPGKPSL